MSRGKSGSSRGGAKGPRRRASSGVGSRKQLEAQAENLRQRLAGVNRQLRAIGRQDKPSDSADLRRRREALRRRRIALMLRIDEFQAEIPRTAVVKGKRREQGPKSGVRSVSQGGSPGLGKRA